MLKQIKSFFRLEIVLRLLIVVAGIFVANEAMASATSVTISAIGTNVNHAVKNVSNIIEDIAIVSGIGFVFASFFKFHAHKQNPQQVPLSQGITLLLIGAGLTIFPHMLNTATKGVFGTNAGGGSLTGLIS